MEIFVNGRFITQKITGVQRVAVEICKQLKKQNSSVKFLSPRNILHRDLAEMLDVTVVGRLTGHLWEQIELPIFLKKRGTPVLLNLCNNAPVYYPRNVVMIHDLAWLRNPEWFSWRFYWYYRWMVPAIVKKALKILAVSDFSKQEIIELLKESQERIEVIPNAVAQGILGLAQKNYVNNYGRYVLAVSSIEPRKNFSCLIEAFLKLRLDDVKLVIAGGKSYAFSNVKITAEMLHTGKIVFAGHREDKELVALYKHALCFVYPSLYEGFGIPPLEAMVCGCPVVASRIASLSEVCGDAAYYIDPYDVNSVAEGIRRLVNDEILRKRLIEKGMLRALYFSWEKSTRKLLDVIEKVNKD